MEEEITPNGVPSDTLKGTSEGKKEIEEEKIVPEVKEATPLVEKKIEEDKTPEEPVEEKEVPEQEKVIEEKPTPEGVSRDISKEMSTKDKEQPKIIPKDKQAKEGSFMPIIIIMIASLFIAGGWDKFPPIKNSIHAVLDPSLGLLLNWNIVAGMLFIVLLISLITTLVQKYATDQKTLKELKKEQKEIQAQMKEFKAHPEKMMALQKKQFAMMPKQMKLSMRAIAYTGIPFILLFRWFYDYFATIPEFRFFGFLTWFWFYLIGAMVFSSILRKKMDVV
jgi:uncharacterized membrane protein (DUF106 family)